MLQVESVATTPLDHCAFEVREEEQGGNKSHGRFGIAKGYFHYQNMWRRGAFGLYMARREQ